MQNAKSKMTPNKLLRNLTGQANQNPKFFQEPYWKKLEGMAREVIQDPIRKLGKDILLILLYGSVAIKTATRHSDIDICIVTRRKRYLRRFVSVPSRIPGGLAAGMKVWGFVRDGVSVNMWSETLPEFRRTVFEPSFEWRVSVRLLIDSKVLYGKPSLFDSLKRKLGKLNKKKFRKSAQIMMQDMYEYLQKLESARERRDFILFKHATYELAQMSASIVSLLNMVPIGHRDEYFPPKSKLKIVPKGFGRDFRMLLFTNDSRKAIHTARHLYQGLSGLFPKEL